MAISRDVPPPFTSTLHLHGRLYLDEHPSFPSWTAGVLAYRIEVCPTELI